MPDDSRRVTKTEQIFEKDFPVLCRRFEACYKHYLKTGRQQTCGDK